MQLAALAEPGVGEHEGWVDNGSRRHQNECSITRTDETGEMRNLSVHIHFVHVTLKNARARRLDVDALLVKHRRE